MKNLFRQSGLAMGEFTWFLRTAWDNDRKKILNKVMKEIGLPAFVKPANLGSSVGISKAKTKAELERAIDFAAKFDRKILVEKSVNAREIEVSVLGNDEPIASLPGEIIPGEDFYSYSDKYVTDAAKLEIPAKISKKLATEIQKQAVRAFQAVDGSGLSRVDFFLEKETDRILINEINTMPGFTSISMYPKLWEISGVPYAELIDRLIALAIDRHKEKSRSQFKI
jgi:D-alanine-D-alanine ligase